MFSSNLALDYMTRASSIKENYFLESDEKQFEKIMNEMNQLEYKKNVADVTSGLRKRGSILKAPGTSGNEKKKVHWPENLPRYTIEKRWRNLKKVKGFPDTDGPCHHPSCPCFCCNKSYKNIWFLGITIYCLDNICRVFVS